MVRLKVLTHNDEQSELRFQFHYGTIKSAQKKADDSSLPYFNSTMVRLKVAARAPYQYYPFHFNSTMVRLKENPKFFLTDVFSISIPLWYD